MTLRSRLKEIFHLPEPAPTTADLVDLGLSKADYAQLMRGDPGTRGRMEHIAARFGVDAGTIDRNRGLALELALTCSQCGASKACQNAIDRATPFDTSRCPNAAIYADMADPGGV